MCHALHGVSRRCLAKNVHLAPVKKTRTSLCIHTALKMQSLPLLGVLACPIPLNLSRTGTRCRRPTEKGHRESLPLQRTLKRWDFHLPCTGKPCVPRHGSSHARPADPVRFEERVLGQQRRGCHGPPQKAL